MKKQNVTEEQLEGLLWENSRKYTRGEITAKEFKDTLSSHSKEERIRFFLIVFMVFLSLLLLIVGVTLYVTSNGIIVLLINCLGITLLLFQTTRYYLKKRKEH